MSLLSCNMLVFVVASFSLTWRWHAYLIIVVAVVVVVVVVVVTCPVVERRDFVELLFSEILDDRLMTSSLS